MNITFYPEFHDQQEFDFFYRQLCWGLKPLRNKASVTLHIKEWIDLSALQPMDHINIKYLQSGHKTPLADFYFIWRQDYYWRAPRFIKMRGLNVDEFSGSNIFDKYCQFVYEHDVVPKSDSITILQQHVKEAHADSSLIRIIGSGSSLFDLITQVAPAHDAKQINIYLGSAIIYKELVDKIPPSYIVATDGASQFGRSETATRFRNIAIRLIRDHNAIVVTQCHFEPMVASHWPQDVHNNFIYVPLRNTSTKAFPRSTTILEAFEVYKTLNVLTCIALPLATAFGKQIAFYGVTLSCDKLNEAKHWDHYREVFYRSHVAPLLAMHLSALPKEENYVNNHQEILGQMLLNYMKTGYTFTANGVEVQPQDVSYHSSNSTKKNAQKPLYKKIGVEITKSLECLGFTNVSEYAFSRVSLRTLYLAGMILGFSYLLTSISN